MPQSCQTFSILNSNIFLSFIILNQTMGSADTLANIFNFEVWTGFPSYQYKRTPRKHSSFLNFTLLTQEQYSNEEFILLDCYMRFVVFCQVSFLNIRFNFCSDGGLRVDSCWIIDLLNSRKDWFLILGSRNWPVWAHNLGRKDLLGIIVCYCNSFLIHYEMKLFYVFR